MSRTRCTNSETVYSGRVFHLKVDTIELQDGGTAVREVIEHPGSVVMAAIDENGQVAMARQYRYSVDRELLELPAGTLEEGENPAPAAVRELREEVGVTAARWDRLGEFFSSPGFLHENMYAFLARGLSSAPRDLDEDEDIDVEWVPLKDLLDSPELLADAKTLATLLLAQRFLERENLGS